MPPETKWIVVHRLYRLKESLATDRKTDNSNLGLLVTLLGEKGVLLTNRHVDESRRWSYQRCVLRYSAATGFMSKRYSKSPVFSLMDLEEEAVDPDKVVQSQVDT